MGLLAFLEVLEVLEPKVWPEHRVWTDSMAYLDQKAFLGLQVGRQEVSLVLLVLQGLREREVFPTLEDQVPLD